MRNPIRAYRPRHARSSYVRPYLIAHEQRRSAQDAAFRQLAGLAVLASLGSLR